MANRYFDRDLHPADLFVARKHLEKLRNPEARAQVIAKAETGIAVLIPFWNEELWSWHNDVPDDRMFEFSIWGNCDERFDHMVEWFESEIERVEKMLVRFYLDHQALVPKKEEGTIRAPKAIEIPFFFHLMLPLCLMASAGFGLLRSDAGVSRSVDGIFLTGGIIMFFVMLAIRRRMTVALIREQSSSVSR
jgi:hypothetical protein